MSLIKIKDVVKKYITYGTVTMALENVSLNIEEGEMVAIMGPSGSGKTTMLNILGCLDKPTSGEYYIDERQVESLSSLEMAQTRNNNIGFIFQQFALIDDHTVQENIELPLIYKNLYSERKDKLSRKEINSRVLNMLESLGIKEHRFKYPYQLSGGQQQRVAIARALVSEPEIVIADEPTGALDQKNGREVMNLLVDINKRGKTVIIVTHDENIAAYCNRRIDILDGQVVKDSIKV
ncbi:ABC transporter ATP-binding protein [Clostridium folliculivorans]|uniref:ABC transporter ATP-binding protein n=1 Tax=Clostridium folliculivorans TaxID=2886038 RepID=A0A9W5Y2B2_9CLOT|nr:ABC transporter ATP-binding protein [Clostridium folliculivorans]GKU25419.1 ABC transporter ATP-binding protein [Clostridium folliculivorans]GKU28441.1 ABC transporter ATP-binding protein [Clostridium folliculivorans]